LARNFFETEKSWETNLVRNTNPPSDQSSEHHFVGVTSEPEIKPYVTRILLGIYSTTEELNYAELSK
jgi:hypothetical protein